MPWGWNARENPGHPIKVAFQINNKQHLVSITIGLAKKFVQVSKHKTAWMNEWIIVYINACLCVFIGRTDAEAAAPILWPPDVMSQFVGKDPDAGKDWRQEKGVREDEMVGWHHWLNGHEFEQAPGDGERQGSLVCCSPWVAKSQTWLSDWTELNWIDI